LAQPADVNVPAIPASCKGRLVQVGSERWADRASAEKPSTGVPPYTDAVGRFGVEDVRMPSIWIIVAGAVGALNVRLLAPGVAAFFGFGKYS
jgi:hypothetical protein